MAVLPEILLELNDVSAGYGSTTVLDRIDLHLRVAESISIIGRNGVGKTTLLATVMGHTELHQGGISLAGDDLAKLTTYQRVWAGLGYVPQEREIFPSLSVLENLVVATRSGAWTATRVFDVFPQLYQRRNNAGNQLSGGEQQMLAIGRALVGNPKVLLLDEPSEGLAPVIVAELQAALIRLRKEEAMAMVLVEQNSHLALNFASRCVVLDRGKVCFDGASEQLKSDQELLNQLIGVADVSRT